MVDIVYQEESFSITGACFEVYREKGHGFLEAVFQECLSMEFELRGIPYVGQPTLRLSYKGRILKQVYQPDFVCYDKIIIELKAVKAIMDEHRAQTINYLKATGLKIGLLINFGKPKIEIKRVAL